MVIKRLELQRFGKFNDTVFEFAAVTVILGRNESGKTTIFDALHKGLANPSRTTKAGKKLKERYQDRDQVTVVSEKQLSFAADSFLNLHAVRAGDLQVELNDRSEWMQVIKARLFSGGINPETLWRRFEDLSSVNANRVHMRELVQLEKQRHDLEIDLLAKRQLKESILSREIQIKSLNEQVELAARKRQSAADAIDQLEKELLVEDKLRQRTTEQVELQRLQQARQIKAQKQAVEQYASHELARLERLVVDEQNLRTDCKIELAKQEVIKKQLLDIQANVAEQTAALEQVQRLVLAANQIRAKLETVLSDPPLKRYVYWNPYFLVIAAMVVMATVLVASNSPQAIPARPFAILGGTILACLLLFFSYRREWRKDTDKEQAVFSALRQEWQQYGQMPEDHSSAAFRDVLHLNSQAEKPHVAALTKLRLEAQYVTEQAELQNQTVERVKAALQHVGQQISAILQVKQAVDVHSYRQAVQIFGSLSQQLQALLADFPDDDEKLAARILFLNRHLNRLDDEGINGQSKTEKEIFLLKKKLEDCKEKMAQAARTEVQAQTQQARISGTLEGELRHLPQQILRIERELSLCSEAIDRLKIQREAAGLAASLFKQMVEDSRLRFRQLTLEVERLLNEIDYKTDIEVSRLALEDFMVMDQGGALRPLEQLSTGTRDLFLLAARLVLLRHSEGPKLLILDEPFTTLDAERETQALKLLSYYQKAEGAQLIFLTKAKELAVGVQQNFTANSIITLN